MLPFLLPAFALVLACAVAPSRDEFRGTPFTGETQAADFHLTDQFGNPSSLQDFAGEVVLLTFLYTDCPDVCPIVANHLRDISALLEDDYPKTAIVIVSVDPAGDTVESVRAYSERWGMAGEWTYLVGDEAALRPVWKAYYIDPYIHGPGRRDADADATPMPTQQAQGVSAQGGGVSAIVEQSGRVIHSAPIYVIDGAGMMRSAFTLPLEAEDVAHDVGLAGG